MYKKTVNWLLDEKTVKNKKSQIKDAKTSVIVSEIRNKKNNEIFFLEILITVIL